MSFWCRFQTFHLICNTNFMYTGAGVLRGDGPSDQDFPVQRWRSPCLRDLQVNEPETLRKFQENEPETYLIQRLSNLPLHEQFRLGLPQPLCPICRKRMAGRATGMENFLRVSQFLPLLLLLFAFTF